MTLPHPSEPNCRLCAVMESRADDFTPLDASTAVAHVGPSAIFLVRRDSREILVAPGDHVSRLTSLPPPEMAQFLASVRRVVMGLNQVQGNGHLETEEMPDAHGHVVIRLAPIGENAPHLFESDPQLAALLRASS